MSLQFKHDQVWKKIKMLMYIFAYINKLMLLLLRPEITICTRGRVYYTKLSSLNKE